MTLIHMAAEYFHARDDIVKEFHIIQKTYNASLAKAMWDMNLGQLQPTFLGMVQFPALVGVKLENHRGEDVGASGLILNRNGQIVKATPATLYSSRGVVFDKVKLGFMFIVINAAIKTIGLWILFLWVFRRMLGRPLAALTDATAQIQLDRLEHLRVAVQTRGRNELKALEEAFNAMIGK